jgi:hypothetical protein
MKIELMKGRKIINVNKTVTVKLYKVSKADF